VAASTLRFLTRPPSGCRLGWLIQGDAWRPVWGGVYSVIKDQSNDLRSPVGRRGQNSPIAPLPFKAARVDVSVDLNPRHYRLIPQPPHFLGEFSNRIPKTVAPHGFQQLLK